MPVNDLLKDGQANTYTCELPQFVQPLKQAEDSFEVLRFTSQSVVLHRKCPLIPSVPKGRNVCLRHARFWYLMALPTGF